MDQSGRGRRLGDVRAVQFGDEEITERRVSDIDGIAYHPIPAVIAAQDPRHVASRVRDRFGNLHEHAVDSARAVEDPQRIGDPTLVQRDIDPSRSVIFQTMLEDCMGRNRGCTDHRRAPDY